MTDCGGGTDESVPYRGTAGGYGIRPLQGNGGRIWNPPLQCIIYIITKMWICKQGIYKIGAEIRLKPPLIPLNIGEMRE